MVVPAAAGDASDRAARAVAGGLGWGLSMGRFGVMGSVAVVLVVVDGMPDAAAVGVAGCAGWETGMGSFRFRVAGGRL